MENAEVESRIKRLERCVVGISNALKHNGLDPQTAILLENIEKELKGIE